MPNFLKTVLNIIKNKKVVGKNVEKYKKYFTYYKGEYLLDLPDTIYLINDGYNKNSKLVWADIYDYEKRVINTDENYKPSNIDRIENYYTVQLNTEHSISYNELRKNISKDAGSKYYPCISLYNFINWAIEHYSIYVHVFIKDEVDDAKWSFKLEDVNSHYDILLEKNVFDNYEEALINGIKTTLELIKQ